MKWDAIVRHYLTNYQPGSEQELNWFRAQPSVASAIKMASLAIRDEKGKRFLHQRRINRFVLFESESILLSAESAISKAKSFDELFGLIKNLLQDIKGLGELYYYDTALRIGSKLNLVPTKVYLHAGTRVGAKALGLNHKEQYLELNALPKELLRLQPYEIEDVLCIYKRMLKA
jgi:hypothetical protein